MSSNAYSATLKPDPWLRILVLSVGRLLFAAGLALILTLPLDVVVRASGSALWLALGVYELSRLQRGFASCRAVRLRCDGSVEVWCRDEKWRAGCLSSGSVVLENLAWLRLRLDSGPLILELFRGAARDCDDWRRLQVIWRHTGGALERRDEAANMLPPQQK
jgi:hypothetical protein